MTETILKFITRIIEFLVFLFIYIPGITCVVIITVILHSFVYLFTGFELYKITITDNWKRENE